MTATLTPPKSLSRHSNGGLGLERLVLADHLNSLRLAFKAWGNFLRQLNKQPIKAGDVTTARQLRQEAEVLFDQYKTQSFNCIELDKTRNYPRSIKLRRISPKKASTMRKIKTAIERADIPTDARQALEQNRAAFLSHFSTRRQR